jgi:hypothetical protein
MGRLSNYLTVLEQRLRAITGFIKEKKKGI